MSSKSDKSEPESSPITNFTKKVHLHVAMHPFGS